MSHEGNGYRNPAPTVDVIIEIQGDGDGPPGIVLIERRNEPHGWALPGGFVDYGERLSDAAAREAREETELDVDIRDVLGSYSDPSRDPRKHTISTVFIGSAEGAPRAADDAKNAAVFSTDDLPEPLVFDHGLILEDYVRLRDRGERPPPTR
jgi:ADP-ribose pyrophosphatase YjhB (NUDIX family)